ncbi:MAG: hypothetical protein WDA72_01270 [Desulfomonilia bacterium]
MYKIAGCFSLIETLGLFGFIVVSKFQGGSLFGFVPLLIAFVVAVYVAFSKAKGISIKEIILVSFMASSIIVSVVQFLGFTFYPGLAKDIEFFSSENAIRIVLMLVIGMLGHVLLMAVARIGRTWPTRA